MSKKTCLFLSATKECLIAGVALVTTVTS